MIRLPFALLARLWLHEPDASVAADVIALLQQPPATPNELAAAYASLFLLNVYPYGTVFTDPSGELNGSGAQYTARLYAAHGYQPPELQTVGAADHLGLYLGFLAHLAEHGQSAVSAKVLAGLLAWAPALCLAIKRDPQANDFYRAVAANTAEALLASASAVAPIMAESDVVGEEEVRLWQVVSFFLTPARCGLFLSRSRLGVLARSIGLALPFGARYEVAQHLFHAAGQSGQVPALLAALESEVVQWVAVYQRWAIDYPAWTPAAASWLARTRGALQRLDEMKKAIMRA